MRNQNLKVYGNAPSITKGKLVKFAYRLLKESLEKAIICIEKNEIEKAGELIIIAQDTVYELNLALDFQINSTIGMQFRNIYDFLFRQLLMANVEKSIPKLREGIELIVSLQELWDGVLEKQDSTLESNFYKGSKINGHVGKDAIKKQKSIAYVSKIAEDKKRLDIKR